jgi:adenosylcobinamide kinase/adenosylcobinamide-phosphate guanylyltransferase
MMQETYPKSVTLVLGGVRSGKSSFAVKLASRASCVAFIATAKPTDAEMSAKIKRHQDERPELWHTFEEPLEIARTLIEQSPNYKLFLIDCLTIFAANLLDANSEDSVSTETRIDQFCDALRSIRSSVILVSNEVGSGVVPAFPTGRQFRDLLGEINQRVAAASDNVLLMVAGLPLILKGKWEAGA